ncbi:hypothetical protein ACD592_12525 [Rhizobium sp. 969_B3_N1_2]|uniref:hypothetical protein n=1 Tax=Rhizobium sp. 969_B3_N1_2 TaxID=3276278 RepID=UPI003F2302BA
MAKWLMDLGVFLPLLGLLGSLSVISTIALKAWSKARGLFDRYDAAVDKYIIDGPQSASADLQAVGKLGPISAKRRAVIIEDLLAMKAILRELGDASNERSQNLADRFDRDPEEFQEFKATLEAMEAALDEFRPDADDLARHRQTLRRYYEMSLSPYDRAMKSLADKTASRSSFAGPVSYAEE